MASPVPKHVLDPFAGMKHLEVIIISECRKVLYELDQTSKNGVFKLGIKIVAVFRHRVSAYMLVT